MTSKYHISPQTGRPNLCRAEENCPIGGEHYASKADAQADYETSMATVTVAPSVSKRGPYTSPFRPTQQVEGTTMWAYSDVLAEAGSKTKLAKANPGVAFSEGPNGLMVLRGKASVIESYLQESGRAKRDVAASLSGLRAALPRRVTNVAPPTPPARAVKKLAVPADLVEEPDLASEDLPQSDFAAEELHDLVLDDATLDANDVADLDEDWDDIKCDDCARPLSACVCGQCSYCEAYDGEHEEDCLHYRARPKAYSWD